MYAAELVLILSVAITVLKMTILVNGVVHELVSSPKGRTHLCEGDIMMYTCTVSGTHLKWLNSSQLVFTSSDKVNFAQSYGKFTAVLLSNAQLSTNEWSLSSILFVNVTVSIQASNILCSSDNDTQTLKSSISGDYLCLTLVLD